MFDIKKVKEIVLSTLVADAYSLGAHWVYDEKQLSSLDVNWNELNDPKAIWHKDKKSGDFTHYGDQTLWLYEFVQDKNEFNAKDFISFWQKKVEVYNGYIDGATRETLVNIENDVYPSGSPSTDLSIIGRIAPLLLVSNTKEEFLKNVEAFVLCTHNSVQAVNSAKYFASVLLEVLNGTEIEEAIDKIKEKFDSSIQTFVSQGLDSKTKNTFETIRTFGPACDISDGFSGVIHLLTRYDNLKEMLVCNAKAGGDTSARAMIASMIFVAKSNINQIPASWLNIKATIL